jgi:1-acyl-sn-glycerol-3-phosphate acyltransferase
MSTKADSMQHNDPRRAGPLIVLRSLLFLLILVVVTPPWALLMILCFPLPHRARRYTAVPWVLFATWLIKHVLGIDYRVLGRENIPDRPAVILSKHQSAWETVVLQEVFSLGLFVWKKELKFLPFFGWALAVIPMISIDRGAGKNALQQLVDQGRLRLGQGYPVIIFPEGTRVAPGHHKRYKVGGAHLGVEAGAPVLPVALNSGEFWGRHALIKYPGTVTVSIGPAIDPTGLSAEDINARAEAWMEAEMRRISPQLYRHETAQSATRSAA